MNIRSVRIKQRREELEISQEKLAELVGLTQTQISRYEIGESDPKGAVLTRLAKVLNTSADWLLGLSDQHPEDYLDEIEHEALMVLRSKDKSRRMAIIEIMRIAQ